MAVFSYQAHAHEAKLETVALNAQSLVELMRRIRPNVSMPSGT